MDIFEWVTDFYQKVTTEKRVIGKSLFKREIYAVKIGDGSPVGLAQYAIHGREYITALLAAAHYRKGVAKGSLWLVPLVNPDGALLCERGLDSVARESDKKLLLRLNGGGDFSLWKANGRGVDLNVNFPANWGKGAKNTMQPGRENCIGPKPFSEPESRALQCFTEQIKPDYTVSYHTKGEEIYWYFYQPMRFCARDKRLALALSDSTGYALAHAKGSAGGYKDWCIQKFGIPSFTIEAGKDAKTHPLKEDSLEEVLRHNENALYDLSEAY